MSTNPEQLQRIFEAALLVAGRPLTIADLQKLFDEADQPDAKAIREILQTLQERYKDHVVVLREVASGFQFQAKQEFSPWLSRLWEERAPRFSRAFLETIALIAYRQPITRAEIEEIRGVAVSTNIIKTLQEREWIRVLGYRDVPGKPALYGTTKTFLDHLNLKSLDELPPLSELMDLESQEEKLQVELQLNQPNTQQEITEKQEETIEEIELDEIAETLIEEESDNVKLDPSHEINIDEDLSEISYDLDEQDVGKSSNDEDDITSDPYPEETSKA